MIRKAIYSRSIVQALMAATVRAGYEPQSALLVDFASDASALLSTGVDALAGYRHPNRKHSWL